LLKIDLLSKQKRENKLQITNYKLQSEIQKPIYPIYVTAGAGTSAGSP
jgi:hypothetical protein